MGISRFGENAAPDCWAIVPDHLSCSVSFASMKGGPFRLHLVLKFLCSILILELLSIYDCEEAAIR